MGFCLSPQHTSIQVKIKGSARSEWVFVCLPSTLAFRPKIKGSARSEWVFACLPSTLAFRQRLKEVLGVSGFLFVSPAH